MHLERFIHCPFFCGPTHTSLPYSGLFLVCAQLLCQQVSKFPNPTSPFKAVTLFCHHAFQSGLSHHRHVPGEQYPYLLPYCSSQGSGSCLVDVHRHTCLRISLKQQWERTRVLILQDEHFILGLFKRTPLNGHLSPKDLNESGGLI